MITPTRLTPPPYKAYSFISLLFWVQSASVERNFIAGGIMRSPPDDLSFWGKCYDKPSRVRPEQLAPLDAMSDETFAKLAPIINLTVGSRQVTTRAEFDIACDNQAEEVDRAENEIPYSYSREQLQSYLVFYYRQNLDPHWGDLADLYNSSTTDQQQAIFGFFKNCLARDLGVLYDTPIPVISIPSEVIEEKEAVIIDDQEQCYCEITKQWKRADHYHRSFLVEGRCGDYSTCDEEITLISPASSLKEAFAIATAFVLDRNNHPHFSKILISHDGIEQAEAEIISSGDYGSNSSARLKWEVDQFENPLLKREMVLETIAGVEKVFGLKWTKISRLENDLGL